MDSRKIVYRESAIIAIGEVILSAVMVGVYVALGYFKMNVLWGALTGCVAMSANYFLMAVIVSVATDKATAGEVAQAQKIVKISSLVRLLLLALIMFVGYKLGANVIAMLLPLLFVRPIMLVAEFFRKKEGN